MNQGTPGPAQVTHANRGPDFVDLYANASRVGITPFDFSMVFSRTSEIAPGVPFFEELAVVRMAPHQFKVFVETMNSTLTAWESVFGAIPLAGPTIPVDNLRASMLNMKQMIEKSGTVNVLNPQRPS
jgi:Protein of unknown function (DUF3467)